MSEPMPELTDHCRAGWLVMSAEHSAGIVAEANSAEQFGAIVRLRAWTLFLSNGQESAEDVDGVLLFWRFGESGQLCKMLLGRSEFA